MKKSIFLIVFLVIVLNLLNAQETPTPTPTVTTVYYFEYNDKEAPFIMFAELITFFSFSDIKNNKTVIGVEYITPSPDPVDQPEYIERFFLVNGYKVKYLGTKVPKELKDILKLDVYTSNISSKSKKFKTKKDLKDFGVRVFDQVILDKKGKVKEIKHVTATAEPLFPISKSVENLNEKGK